MTYHLTATSYTTSHLLCVHDGWIEAKRVDTQTGWGWRFKSGQDAVRWLRS